jgi:hypothetical protein
VYEYCIARFGVVSVSLLIVGLARSESRVELEFKRACLN